MKTKLEELIPGDWILLEYGNSYSEWYVLYNTDRLIKICKPSWCVNDAIFIPYNNLNTKNWMFIKSTKMRWWWKFLPIRNLFCPYPPL